MNEGLRSGRLREICQHYLGCTDLTSEPFVSIFCLGLGEEVVRSVGVAGGETGGEAGIGAGEEVASPGRLFQCIEPGEQNSRRGRTEGL